MLYDLYISWTPGTTPAELERTLAMSAELGYDVVALNHTLVPPIPASISNPLPSSVSPSPSSSTPSDPMPTAVTTTQSKRKLPRQLLRRATVVIADTTTNHRLGAVASAYDLLAVRPTTEKAFQAACTSMTEPSLISLDLCAFFPFHFRPKPCMAAVRRGLRFEVCYAQALRASPSSSSSGSGGTGDRARALFLGNLRGLVRATRGRGIVLSSGAAGALELRGPADVVNLLAACGGLGPDRGTEALCEVPRSVVVNEGLRRRSFRGVVEVVQGAGVKTGEGLRKQSGDGEKVKETEKGKGGGGGGGKGEEEKNQKHQPPPKRKAAPGEDSPGPAEGGGEPKTLSKRQAKKLKRAQMGQEPPRKSK